MLGKTGKQKKEKAGVSESVRVLRLSEKRGRLDPCRRGEERETQGHGEREREHTEKATQHKAQGRHSTAQHKEHTHTAQDIQGTDGNTAQGIQGTHSNSREKGKEWT